MLHHRRIRRHRLRIWVESLHASKGEESTHVSLLEDVLEEEAADGLGREGLDDLPRVLDHLDLRLAKAHLALSAGCRLRTVRVSRCVRDGATRFGRRARDPFPFERDPYHNRC